MSPEQPSPRIRKSPEQVRSAVHQAVIDLLSDPEGADLTIPAIAQRAGVNHTSIYRRWGSREALLADVVTTRLERDWPLKDTGSLRGDLIAWAEAGVASIRTPEGRLLIRAVALSMPSSPAAQGERAQQFQRRIAAIERIRERAAARGESPPPLEQILDQLIAPLYLRAIFGIDPPASGYP
ncbi:MULTISPECIES: TetR/AcrR family transcriptional regulator [Streptomyces]|uniref:TetR/AcrR family transcriptional regulator n=1 Tax=Streptomyces TaxID=1883 RepID=UPI00345B5BC3